MNNLTKLGFDNWFWESIASGKDKIDFDRHRGHTKTRNSLPDKNPSKDNSKKD